MLLGFRVAVILKSSCPPKGNPFFTFVPRFLNAPEIRTTAKRFDHVRFRVQGFIQFLKIRTQFLAQTHASHTAEYAGFVLTKF